MIGNPAAAAGSWTRPIPAAPPQVHPVAGHGPQGCVPALGTIRRLRALAAAGWPARSLASAAKVNPRTIGHIRAGRRHYIHADIAAAVAEIYAAASSLRPEQKLPPTTSARRAIRYTRELATREGWSCTPDDWAGLDMDDPKVGPATDVIDRTYQFKRRTTTAGDVLELIRTAASRTRIRNAWARLGLGERPIVVAALSDSTRPGGKMSGAQIAALFGVSQRAITRHRMAPRPDTPAAPAVPARAS
ncbi:hypothetical protein K1T35_47995 (plasmid) [Pseudonocardia sp. DSM 110487]|uniref:hypothetical protein n=1 Tax=Pseudonocardia sp. DSM 110487 TaxID=2865833 RepID=UPI001C69D194|nr:hypothetical protein [Pseudonocardia sp. DSM 110487]QYN41094.1 hypothetical protein K1T35_47995 [Pseudonocardia sp. DSM 110487]